MKIMTIDEAEMTFYSLLTEIEQKGEIFVICRNGEPIADLIPHPPKKRTDIHPLMSQIKIRYDLTETLTSEEWSDEE